jgi:hypothetical protein
MKAEQIVALIFAILLLLPGGCFLLLGFALRTDSDAPSIFLIAAAILGVAGLLFWVAFRRRTRGNP